MDLNSDFGERVAVHAAKMEWTASPMPGVDRRMLDRIGGEVARATSFVRYAPGSHFSPHVHTGGEEFLVLEGVFQDEHGDFPAGSYVRNPPETVHTPGSESGCVIFVKLWQFDMADRRQVRINTNQMTFSADPSRPGVETITLFNNDHEHVSLERWPANSPIQIEAPDGMEILVLDGMFHQGGEDFSGHSWLRLPKGSRATALSGPTGARIWSKRDHLAKTPEAPKTPK